MVQNPPKYELNILAIGYQTSKKAINGPFLRGVQEVCINLFLLFYCLCISRKQLQRPEPEAGSPFWRLAEAICHLNFPDKGCRSQQATNDHSQH